MSRMGNELKMVEDNILSLLKILGLWSYCFIKKEKEKEKEKGGTKNREKRKFEGNGRESKMALFIVAF